VFGGVWLVVGGGGGGGPAPPPPGLSHLGTNDYLNGVWEQTAVVDIETQLGGNDWRMEKIT
jgi:hypothetical protein